ncbi:MAG: RHS repeat-associated core domain-containing protein, partial [Sneathiellales bacterium]|nr:RHS repeat-associated core domain-containing protein [Sneathiellales bacterium]
VKSLLNPDGSIASRHYPDGRQLGLGYSVEGWISSLGWKGTSPLARFEDHDLYGKPSGAFYANGVTEKSRSDASGNLLTFSVLNRARRPLLFQRYSYGEGYMGMVSALEESRQGRSGEQYRFNYDSSARLTNVSKTDKGLIEHYEFGKADNVIQFEAEQTLFKAQNALNSYQITDYSGAKGADGYLAYSESGDLKSWIAAGEQHEYRYDPFGYVQKSTVGAGKKAKSAEFVREQTGNRLCKITSEGQVYFRLDDDFELSRNTKGEWFATAFLQNENGCVVESTLPFKGFTKNSKFFRKLKAPHKVNTKSLKASDLQEERQAGDIYLHLDIRGSSLLATNMDGKVLASLHFSSRGLIDTKSSSGKISFTPVFAGMQYDADLALYDAGARYYNPKIGIFLSPDPIRDSVDPYAYPADPVNYYDDRGECGRFNWKRRFARNCGRGFTILGWVLTSFFISVLFYVIWDISVFGIDADEALRWGLVVGTWFALAGFLEMSLLQCSGLNRANTNCEILLAETARLVTSTAVGAIILPPMGCFIGTSPETPVPWDPTNCEPHHYMSNLSRGVVVTAASSVIKTVGRLLIKRVKWFDKSVVGKYLSSICINYVGYASWQGLDTLYVHTFMKMSLKEIWAPGKLSFATGEIILGLLLASPNIILAVIPASLCQRFSWNWFATPRLTTEGGDRYLPIWPNGSSEYVDLDADQEAEQSRRRDNYEVLGSGHTDQTIVMTSSPQAQNYGALSHHSEFGEELLDQGDDLQQGSSGDEGGSEEGILELEMINEGELRRQIPSLSPEEEEEDNKTEDKERDDLSDLEKGQGKDEDATD